jgi:hypothetical protein
MLATLKAFAIRELLESQFRRLFRRARQRWGGGPPIEGSLATFGSILMLGVGVYIILLAFFQKSDDHS